VRISLTGKIWNAIWTIGWTRSQINLVTAQPSFYYEQAEQAHMLPYLSPSCLKPSAASHIMTRKADKAGLISWQSNKYSVPLLYQSTQVGVTGDGSQLRSYRSSQR